MKYAIFVFLIITVQSFAIETTVANSQSSSKRTNCDSLAEISTAMELLSSKKSITFYLNFKNENSDFKNFVFPEALRLIKVDKNLKLTDQEFSTLLAKALANKEKEGIGFDCLAVTKAMKRTISDYYSKLPKDNLGVFHAESDIFMSNEYSLSPPALKQIQTLGNNGIIVGKKHLQSTIAFRRGRNFDALSGYHKVAGGEGQPRGDYKSLNNPAELTRVLKNLEEAKQRK